ncbi:glycosyltransferase [Pseudomonas sp. PS01299]|uniref:glycosyltransferase n=1 Tax=Pseudomonas sp. PS01299 TaxID=2991435 RepID=UPI00249C08E6|nr:glycosyltransferase [Pseudomonas sp. PS01299]
MSLNTLKTIARRLRRAYYILRSDASEPLVDKVNYDWDFYLQQNPDVAASGVDPRDHYFKFGRQEGRIAVMPTPVTDVSDEADGYDWNFYLQQYPDVAAAGVDPRKHYFQFGRDEGRIAVLPKLDFIGSPEDDFDPARETVLVVSHEASRTGAPILSLNLVRILSKRYNVVALLLGGGALVEAFRDAGAVVAGPCEMRHNPVATKLILDKLFIRCQFKFALVNSIESRFVLSSLARHFIPSISLLHEFASYTRPRDAFRQALFWSTSSVFSANLTLQSALDEYPDLDEKIAHILPQGRCELPVAALDEKSRSIEEKRLLDALRPSGAHADTFVVIGAGSVQLRKGVDYFIDCASRVLRTNPSRNVRFVWIGKGFDPDIDIGYSVYLADQIRRAGIEQHITFLEDTSELDIVYQQADVLLMTSRLDPLPNVSIDALCEGLPVVCFESTTGIADILAEEQLADTCVAGYLDTADMAEKLLKLSSDSQLYQDVVSRSLEMAARRFNMEAYVEQLDQLAGTLIDKARKESEDIAEIARANLLRCDFVSLHDRLEQPQDEVIRGYVRAWACGVDQRKPFPGFHPGIYKEQHGLLGVDPLADFIRKGRPEGPWLAPVITPEGKNTKVSPSVKVALHLFVSHPQLLAGTLGRLKQNKLLPDLFISVPGYDMRDEVSRQFSGYAGRLVEVLTLPDSPRDIATFLGTLGRKISPQYDFMGHLHVRMGEDVESGSKEQTGDSFHLENLLGGKSGAMTDRIISRMLEDSTISMVFADDPDASGWGSLRPIAQRWANNVELASLPEYLYFPTEAMFWARCERLAPLWDLGLQLPDEAVLVEDDSALRAIERLLPLSIAGSNLRCAVTNIFGVTR